ncbi:hypothetical protein [Roseicella frigidaeris]|uniref:YXWGXW repeat-containing protein n=1 Tax=Roseicella frigidaeris TaxID=2230885 RepID=A0A327M6Q7_9PROT|nr:hypothetical protein [Roseicella frigidaeris]RAI58125.1 hypothetical protein DOO78_15455 [Roseicella frigidaeris]
MTRFTLRSALLATTLLALPLLAPSPARAWWGPGGWHPGPVWVVPRPVRLPPPLLVVPAPVYRPIYRPIWVPPHFDRYGYWVPGHWR